MNIVFCGPSTAWSNTRHAITYRSLMKGLCALGHEVLCLERDAPGFAARRDVEPDRAEKMRRYRSLEELRDTHAQAVREADVAVVGSRVPDGIAVGEWVLQEAQGVTAFYDLDTPLTLAGLESDSGDYLSRAQVPSYDLYLSSIGGPPLDRLSAEFGARRPRPLYGSVDTDLYRPIERAERWTLGYAGDYTQDRQPALDRLLMGVARMLPERRMVVAGSHYPPGIDWPSNVERIDRLAPAEHPAFYCSQRFALNLTGPQGPKSCLSPSIRIFEAAACGVPVLTDPWPGLDVFFRPGHDVLVVSQPADVLACIGATDPSRRRGMAHRARARVLAEHSHLCRAEEFEGYVADVRGPHAMAG